LRRARRSTQGPPPPRRPLPGERRRRPTNASTTVPLKPHRRDLECRSARPLGPLVGQQESRAHPDVDVGAGVDAAAEPRRRRRWRRGRARSARSERQDERPHPRSIASKKRGAASHCGDSSGALSLSTRGLPLLWPERPPVVFSGPSSGLPAWGGI
jgi:hypothetical protein